jgi:hypothetical protein
VTGFAYALNPEIYLEIDKAILRRVYEEQKEILEHHPNLAVVIGVGWLGANHRPFIVFSFENTFTETELANQLARLFEEVDVSNITS